MTVRRSRVIAWVALWATLFSAVSPALAAAFLADRPDALARMLGVPSPAAANAHGAHAGHVHHLPSDPSAPPPHEKHGVYCSLCLNPSSTVALAFVAALLVISSLGAAAPLREHDRSAASAFQPYFRSRAPPR